MRHSKTFRHENISVFSARETDIGHFNFHSFSQSRSPNAFIAYFTVQRVSQKFTFTLRKIEIYRVAKQIMNEITNLPNLNIDYLTSPNFPELWNN